MDKNKQCSKCSTIQGYSYFNKNKRNLTDGYSSWCKKCIKTYENKKKYKPNYEGNKECQNCSSIKNRIDFHLSKRNPDGLENRCKLCCAKRSRKAEINNYGITQDEYNDLYKVQNGQCAICNRSDTGIQRTKNLSIDHNHMTGIVRGLLCNWCNQGLGMFRDSPELLVKAVNYLKEKI